MGNRTIRIDLSAQRLDLCDGDEVVNAVRFLRVPAEARRRARAAEAPGVALETLGFGLVALAAAGAFFIFLRRLRDGSASLGRAAGSSAPSSSSLFSVRQAALPEPESCQPVT